MRCPTLAELPPADSSKRGWPWTVASLQLPEAMNDGRQWPRISIVTPSFNQADYVEETIRSILLQGYPDLEYVVIDGGSTDASRKIIQKYQKWLSCWVSEPDRGQSCAINKGLRLLTGDVFNWINSDDMLQPQSLQNIAEAYRKYPDSLLAGDVLYRYDDSNIAETVQQANIELRRLVEFWNNSASFHQPGIFIPMVLMKKVGMLDEDLQYAFDYELFCRLLFLADVAYLNQPVAMYRIHSMSKSVSQSHLFLPEVYTASRRYWARIPDLNLPPSDPKGAGVSLRVGLWEILHKDLRGVDRIKEALKVDPLRALSSSALYFPGWLWRRWSRKRQHAQEKTERYTFSREGRN
jgi:glycosyltransferase involved in cell wall biosynthesis